MSDNFLNDFIRMRVSVEDLMACAPPIANAQLFHRRTTIDGHKRDNQHPPTGGGEYSQIVVRTRKRSPNGEAISDPD